MYYNHINLFNEFDNLRKTQDLSTCYDLMDLYRSMIRGNLIPEKEKALQIVQTIVEDMETNENQQDYELDPDIALSFQLDSLYFSMVRDVAKHFPNDVLPRIEACRFTTRQWSLYNGLLFALPQEYQTEQSRHCILPTVLNNTHEREKGIVSAIDKRYVDITYVDDLYRQYQECILKPVATWPNAWAHQFDEIVTLRNRGITSPVVESILAVINDAKTFQMCVEAMTNNATTHYPPLDL